MRSSRLARGGRLSGVLTKEVSKIFPGNSGGRGNGMSLQPVQSSKPESKQRATKLRLDNCLIWAGHCLRTKGHALGCDYL